MLEPPAQTQESSEFAVFLLGDGVCLPVNSCEGKESVQKSVDTGLKKLLRSGLVDD